MSKKGLGSRVDLRARKQNTLHCLLEVQDRVDSVGISSDRTLSSPSGVEHLIVTILNSSKHFGNSAAFIVLSILFSTVVTVHKYLTSLCLRLLNENAFRTNTYSFWSSNQILVFLVSYTLNIMKCLNQNRRNLFEIKVPNPTKSH